MTFNFTHNGVEYTATVEYDQDFGPPWEESDGHGEVSEWTTRDKMPGEMVLCQDHQSHRFYDFAGACQIARRDGWGFLPDKLKTEKLRNGYWRASCLNFVACSRDINQAIRKVYADHRATLSPKAYAAGAAMRDYEYLRRWCNDDWYYVGVIVQRADSCSHCGDSASLWGIEIESDCDDYIREVATELAMELES